MVSRPLTELPNNDYGLLLRRRAQPEKINCNNYSNCNKTIILLE